MYQLVQKMKAVKNKLIVWTKNERLLNPSPIEIFFEAKEKFKLVQSKLLPNPLNQSYIVEENQALEEYFEMAKFVE